MPRRAAAARRHCDRNDRLHTGRIEKAMMASTLHEQHNFLELIVAHLLSRNIQYEADLIDQLFSSKKPLARTLLLLANFGKEGRAETVVPRVNQENWRKCSA